MNDKNSDGILAPRDILAFFGAHNLSNPYEPGRFSLSPNTIFIHDDWNPKTTQYDGDMSLLEFEDDSIHYSAFVQPICIWDHENEPFVSQGTVTGWGRSEDLSKKHETDPKLLKVTILTNEQCFLESKPLIDLSSNRTFCAGLRNGSGVCHGDSGGSLFFKDHEQYYLKGIVSSSLIAEDGCDVSNYAVYTKVVKFRDWIQKITGIILIPSTSTVRPTSTTQRAPSSKNKDHRIDRSQESSD